MNRVHRLDASAGDPSGPATSDARRASSQSPESSNPAQQEHGADEELNSLINASHHAYALQEPVRLIASYAQQLRKACKDQPSTKVNQIVACISDRANQIQTGLGELTAALEDLCRRALEAKVPPANQLPEEERP